MSVVKGSGFAATVLPMLVFTASCAVFTPNVLAQAQIESLNIDIAQSSVSGLSSGGYMATQMQLAHSELIVGAGIVGAGPYYCALGDISIALGQCVDKASQSITNAPFIAKYQEYLQSNLVASRVTLEDDRVVVIHGKKDTTVNRRASDLLVEQYQQWLSKGNLKYIDDKDFGHHMPTLSAGTECEVSQSPFIGNCNYDAAGEILSFIYPELNTPETNSTLSVETLDLSDLADLGGTSIADEAFVFVPNTCKDGAQCKLHISFHGCNQSAEDVKRSYAELSGFNRWANANNIVMLYPQVEKSMFMPLNPQGCWDWWGYTDENYANKLGPQIEAIYNVMQALNKEND
jgi:poly(3-hydroxybutyrate) depolymerase